MSGAEFGPCPQDSEYWERPDGKDNDLGPWADILRLAVAEHVGPLDVATALADIRARAQQQNTLAPETLSTDGHIQ
jgi:hypothetical protein